VRRRDVSAVFAILVMLVGGSAKAADDWHADCRSSYDPNFAECIVKRVGAESANAIRARGGELIRALIFKPDRIDPPILLVDIILPKEGGGQLILYDALDQGVSRTYPFGREQFEPLRQKLQALQGLGAALHGAKPTKDYPRDREGNAQIVCLHGAVGWVQTVIAGAVAAANLDYCQTGDFNFVADILEFAAPMDPLCDHIFPYEIWVPRRLQACVHMQGDRVLAAEGYRGAIETANWKERNKLPPDAELEQIIAPDVRFRLKDGAVVTGRALAMKKWLALGNDRSEVIYKPVDASAHEGMIVVHGIIHRYEHRDVDFDAEFRASSTQVWRVDASGRPRLTEWDIGTFERYRVNYND
jgi:hypothetical protein